ncbi:MAG TPA: hypothetical protein VLF79_02595 [Candidatus Saccharimonadales bacterium]|nr:hypothetical protein [Candidatus Saccharimonadales bacterium]
MQRDGLIGRLREKVDDRVFEFKSAHPDLVNSFNDLHDSFNDIRDRADTFEIKNQELCYGAAVVALGTLAVGAEIIDLHLANKPSTKAINLGRASSKAVAVASYYFTAKAVGRFRDYRKIKQSIKESKSEI